jgi:hypothetical protein
MGTAIVTISCAGVSVGNALALVLGTAQRTFDRMDIPVLNSLKADDCCVSSNMPTVRAISNKFFMVTVHTEANCDSSFRAIDQVRT